MLCEDKMTKVMSLLIAALIFIPIIGNAADVPKGFHDNETAPTLKISHTPEGWPIYQVESVKYYLTLLDIKPAVHVPLTTYLIKEKNTTIIIEGREGQQSTIILELWELGSKGVKKKIWRLANEADNWQFSSEDEIALIKYGCCGEPNKYYYYDIKTGKLLRIKEKPNLPAK
jgi:hypothetical protein